MYDVAPCTWGCTTADSIGFAGFMCTRFKKWICVKNESGFRQTRLLLHWASDTHTLLPQVIPSVHTDLHTLYSTDVYLTLTDSTLSVSATADTH